MIRKLLAPNFRGSMARDSMTSFEGFLARRFCYRFGAGFVLPPAGTFSWDRVFSSFVSPEDSDWPSLVCYRPILTH